MAITRQNVVKVIMELCQIKNSKDWDVDFIEAMAEKVMDAQWLPNDQQWNKMLELLKKR